MPIYTYRAKDPDQSCCKCRDSFDTMQKITEEALTICPECGNEIVRIIHAAKPFKDKSEHKMLSDENLKKHGFKKLVKTGKGTYDEVV
ncbi:MAG: zinc ribbon domain-containing protein [Candidatus Riflebacteria bacterium]